MADFFTKTAFILPCSVAQAEMVQAALDFIENESAEMGVALFNKEPAECSELEILIRNIAERHPEFNAANPGIMTEESDHIDADYEMNLPFEFEHYIEKDGLLISTSTSLDTHHVIATTQGALAAFNLPVMVEIPVAYTCSNAVTGGFGGGAFMVTKDTVSDNSVHDFIRAERDAFEAQEAYYLSHVTHYNGDKSLEKPYLMNIKNTDVAVNVLNTLLLSLASKDDVTEPSIPESGYIAIDENSGISAGAIRRLTPEEYKVMWAYLPNVNKLCAA